MLTSDPPIIVEQLLDASIQQVWQAITRHDQMILWYFEQIPAFEPKVGFTTEFVVTNEGRTFTHQWEVTEVIPEKSITYTWNFPEYPGFSKTTFEIIPMDSGECKLVLTADVLEDYPEGIPEFRTESCLGGWKYFLERLAAYLS